MDDLRSFCCQNSSCSEYGKRGAGNLTVCGHIVGKKRHRQLRCRTCKARFSETKGTVFYHSVLPDEKVVEILEHVAEGNGMRQTGRLTHVKEDAVIRLAKLAGAHAESLHDELIAFSPSDARGATGRKVEFRRQERGEMPRRESGR